MNNLKTIENKKQNYINIFFDENGISIIDLLEKDFSDFVSEFIREKIN